MEASPVRLEGDLPAASQLSRWLWLVKWLLLVPHFVCLVVLWVWFVLTTVVVFFVLLFGGSYPRRLFEINLGIMRWTWRVAFYGYSALATDRYPPFTLAEVPDYPARLDIPYPEEQRHGFALVGRWILGVPQYAIAAILCGGGAGWAHVGFGGVVGVLMFVAAILLLFRHVYRSDVFALAMGANRWVVRAGAYGAFMTPAYPPFRLDTGPREPAA